MGALANKEVGKYVTEYFVASFQKVAILPALLLIVFGAIWLRDKAKGGYKPVKLVD